MQIELSDKFEEATPSDPTSLEETCIHGHRLNPHSSLAGIPSALLKILEPHFRELEFEKGAHLIRQGDPGDCLFVVLSGRVDIFSEEDSGRMHVIAESGPGDVLGEMALLTGESRSANAVAKEHVTALSLSAKTVHELAGKHPDLSCLMTNVVAKRLGAVEYDALAGKSLGGFRLIRRLGKGGMAVVYEAVEPSDDRLVALKMMSHRLVHEPRALEQFEREFDIVRSFDSPYIVQTYSRFAAFHSWFLVMEYCDGYPLDQIVARGPLPESKVRKVYDSISMALGHAHWRGVVHRDIKPSNIMEKCNGEIKLMDFGLATPLTELDRSAGVSGTAYYLAPELLAGEPSSIETDYFALGMTLLELLLGRRPLQSGTVNSVFREIRNWKKPNVRQLRSDLSPEFCDQIADLLDPVSSNRNLHL